MAAGYDTRTGDPPTEPDEPTEHTEPAEPADAGERCHRCDSIGEDRRTLRMDCFYKMTELDIPFDRDLVFTLADSSAHADCIEPVTPPATIELPGRNGLPPQHISLGGGTVRCTGELAYDQQYTLRVCKRCRGEWLAAIKAWFFAPPKGDDHDAAERPEGGCGSGIFVRDNGALKEITREEWDQRVAEQKRREAADG